MKHDVSPYPNVQPLALVASTTLQSNASAGLNAAALKNPIGTPMELLEVRWELQTDLLVEGSVDIGGLIACKLEMGQIALTNGFVPVWSFGKSEGLSPESRVITGLGLPDFKSRVLARYSWRLPRPLFVPAGATVVPTVQHRGLVRSPVNVKVMYVCRALPANAVAPKKVNIPYVAAYVSKAFTTEVTQDSDVSSELDLVNNSGKQLFMQRFTGRVQSAAIYSGAGGVFSNFTQIIEVADGAFGCQALQVRMTDSNGRQIIRDPVFFRNAFSGVTRSWELEGSVMDPDSFYQAFLTWDTTILGALDAVPGQPPRSVQAMVGLVGWYEQEM